jgi:cation diffusion facilitator family transporter
VTADAAKIRMQQWIVAVALLLFGLKMAAYFFTNSVAILTDALESTVNVMAAFMGLYSLNLAAKPRDKEHPYGHGKIEFISAAVEGSFICLAGLFILFETGSRFFDPKSLDNLGTGVVLIAFAGIVNAFVGYLARKKGQQTHSITLEAAGQHLLSDSYTTVGLLAGLGLIWWTGWQWLDLAIAVLLAGVLIGMGYRIIRRSVAGIMDEADESLLRKMIAYLQSNRRDEWIDLHNLRVIKYGSVLHVDCHLTVPWYFDVREAHREVDHLERAIHDFCGRQVELFVHTDPCLEFSCRLCNIHDCKVRQHAFEQRIPWTYDNVRENSRHRLRPNAAERN